ncbi:MAG TPA: hypothetical protein VI078_06935 [bacterium]
MTLAFGGPSGNALLQGRDRDIQAAALGTPQNILILHLFLHVYLEMTICLGTTPVN